MYDVIVIGAGHAGVEAAAASARRGAQTLLLTFDRARVGAMSCNPAIGGLGKGHIVREVDAFDGLIACAADAAAIHYRMLNRSKGTAVQGPRVQADRRLYAAAIQTMLAAEPMLTIGEGEAAALSFDRDRVAGVALADGTIIHARAVVLATGTFLGACIYRGDEREAAGRIGERAAMSLAGQLRGLGLRMGRLKTGTPPRLDGRTIDWAALAEQPSDSEPWTMSPMTPRRMLPQLSCAITRTNATTHAIIADAFDRSPLFTGAIDGQGPRYCPSIEDKVKRFGDRDGHQVFLEPEGLDDALVYPNGLSTSLPTDVQQAMIASIPGLDRAVIAVPGYAVEYDYLDPRSLDHRLALAAIDGLFCAGQINGTTGYEEAAGQGLVAGLNAAAHALDIASVILDRASSYTGVMIDDLVLQGVTEPYRMLTARAEYRLSLRSDNAETRLAGVAVKARCLGPERLAHQRRRAAEKTNARAALDHPITASALVDRGALVGMDGARRSAFEWLRFDGVTLAHVAPDLAQQPSDVMAELLEDARYVPYLARQADEIERLRRDEGVLLSPSIDFAAIPGLSNEMVDRLGAARPPSLAAASRIRGVTEDEARAVVRAQFGEAVEARLAQFAAMVVAENTRQNLVAPSTIERIWIRHILDSLQLVALAPAGRWLDIGTGRGFPGLAVAIATGAKMMLVEPRKRRAQFLADCTQQLELSDRVDVEAVKVADVQIDADIISARAVGSVDILLGWASHCATPSTRWLLPRGKIDYPSLDAAREKWRFMFHVEHSITDPESRILVLDGVTPR